MTFEPIETSRSSGQPIELYRFQYGPEPDAFYAYTNHERDITVENILYEAIPVQRNNIVASGSLDKSALDVMLPITTQIADLFRIYAPSHVVSLTIRQGHVSDTDREFLAIWTGRVLSSERNGSEAKLLCEPVSTSLQRPGLRRQYQHACPHLLYGSRCKANKQSATITQTVVTLTGSSVTLTDNWNGAIAAEKYVTGMIEWATPAGTERRMILQVVDGKTLLLTGPPNGIAAGDAISIVLGCNHEETDCIGLHSNILNYGGQKWIPLENPINKNPFS